ELKTNQRFRGALRVYGSTPPRGGVPLHHLNLNRNPNLVVTKAFSRFLKLSKAFFLCHLASGRQPSEGSRKATEGYGKIFCGAAFTSSRPSQPGLSLLRAPRVARLNEIWNLEIGIFLELG